MVCSKCKKTISENDSIILNEGTEEEIVFCDYCAEEDFFNSCN